MKMLKNYSKKNCGMSRDQDTRVGMGFLALGLILAVYMNIY